MNGVNADAGMAIVLLLVAYGFLMYRFRIVWPDRIDQTRRLSNTPARGSFAAFVIDTGELDDAERKSDAAVYLGDQVAKIYDEVIVASRNLDAKATTILGFVGGGASLYALTAETKTAAQPHPSALLALGIAFFLLSLLACLGCLVVRIRAGLPALRDQFAAPAALNQTKLTTKARVAAYIFMQLQDRLDANRPINAYKSMFVEMAQDLFAFGAIVIVVNYAVVAYTGGTAPAKTATTCTITLVGSTSKLECH